eukprot:2540927-Prymnesium_polylepis.1
MKALTSFSQLQRSSTLRITDRGKRQTLPRKALDPPAALAAKEYRVPETLGSSLEFCFWVNIGRENAFVPRCGGWRAMATRQIPYVDCGFGDPGPRVGALDWWVSAQTSEVIRATGQELEGLNGELKFDIRSSRALAEGRKLA